jgi:hypothetical protein
MKGDLRLVDTAAAVFKEVSTVAEADTKETVLRESRGVPAVLIAQIMDRSIPIKVVEAIQRDLNPAMKNKAATVDRVDSSVIGVNRAAD